MNIYKINIDGSSVAVSSKAKLTDEEVIQKALDNEIIDDPNAEVENITDDDDEKAAFADVTYQI